MNSVKGCANEACVSYQRKVKYKSVDKFCPQCGAELRPVCKSRGCYTFLDDAEQKYCARCLAKRKDREDNGKRILAGIVSTAVGIAAVVAKEGKTIANAISEIAPKKK